MFSQIIRSTQLNTSCLQQSKKKKTRYDCLFFEKNITGRVRRLVHEANIVGVPSKPAQHCCATLRRSQNNRNVGICWVKSLTGFKLYATSAKKCQHCCGSMQTDAISHNIVGPNNVASVCTGLYTNSVQRLAYTKRTNCHRTGPRVSKNANRKTCVYYLVTYPQTPGKSWGFFTYSSSPQQKQIHKLYFNMETSKQKILKKSDAAGNSDAGGDDKLKFFMRPYVEEVQKKK